MCSANPRRTPHTLHGQSDSCIRQKISRAPKSARKCAGRDVGTRHRRILRLLKILNLRATFRRHNTRSRGVVRKGAPTDSSNRNRLTIITITAIQHPRCSKSATSPDICLTFRPQTGTQIPPQLLRFTGTFKPMFQCIRWSHGKQVVIVRPFERSCLVG